MRLIKLIESMLDERTIKSPAADQAKEMGLKYMGYSKWEDPNNPGVAVAKTVQGQLVKIEPGDEPNAEPQARAANSGGTHAEPPQQRPAHPVTGAPSSPPAATPEEPDSYTQTEPEPEMAEPEIPKGDTAIDRLINAASGDYMKVKKVLAKKIREGDGKAKDLMAGVEAHEKAHHEELRKSMADFENNRQSQLGALKQKYASKYPSPQI